MAQIAIPMSQNEMGFLVRDLAKVLNREILGLVAHGCRHIQVPPNLSLSVFCFWLQSYTDDRLQEYSYKQLCVFIFLYILNIGKKTYSQPDAFSEGEICGPVALFGCNSFYFFGLKIYFKRKLYYNFIDSHPFHADLLNQK